MKEWFTAKELAEFNLPTLPSTERNIQLKSKRDCWKFRARSGRGGGNFRFNIGGGRQPVGYVLHGL